jgi:hypothetical protein
MTKNAELAYETLDYIIANPEQWEQKEWICGTSMCFAGHAAVLAGWKPERETGWASKQDHSPLTIGTAAACELGIHNYQSEVLFNPCNSLSDLITVVEKMFGPDPRPKGRTSKERLEEVQMVESG